MDPKTYKDRGIQPPIDQLPDIDNYNRTQRSVVTDADYRLQFLKRLYQDANGDQSKHVNAAAIAEGLGMDLDALRRVTQYLEGEGLIKVQVITHRIPAFVTITHRGIKAAEAGVL